MFDDVLIESAGKDKRKGGWVTAVISAVIHIAITYSASTGPTRMRLR